MCSNVQTRVRDSRMLPCIDRWPHHRARPLRRVVTRDNGEAVDHMTLVVRRESRAECARIELT